MLRKSLIQHETNELNSLKSVLHGSLEIFCLLRQSSLGGLCQCAVLDLTFQNLINLQAIMQAIYCDTGYQRGVVTTPLDLALGSGYCIV